MQKVESIEIIYLRGEYLVIVWNNKEWESMSIDSYEKMRSFVEFIETFELRNKLKYLS